MGNNNNSIKPSEVPGVLLAELKGIDLEAMYAEVGTVLQVSDGVVRIFGLRNAEASELLEFENGMKAVVMNLEEDNVGAVLLGPTDQIKEGDTVRRTGHTASINVSEQMLGRVINPLGVPLDGKGEIGGEMTEMPLDRKAPGVIFRQPVSQPLQTGIKAIDAMIPIGRGQRELIIGDRQTGKTAIAVDTIINQRSNYEAGDPVYCIYVAVGQKASTVASLVETLRRHGAMDYTIVVAAMAADPAAVQYFAPFAGAAIGEYFRDTGRNALVVYDDLSKQAVAYREVSLILRRPSGREAYPGDIFYLHSRLLERAAKIIAQEEVASQGRRCISIYPDQRDLHHRWPDLPEHRPLQRRQPPCHRCRHFGIASRWQRPGQGNEESRRYTQDRPGPVPRTGIILQIQQRHGSCHCGHSGQRKEELETPCPASIQPYACRAADSHPVLRDTRAAQGCPSGARG